MNLCIDIGNTRSKYAVFDLDKLVESGIWKKCSVSKLRNIQIEYPAIQRIIISTVTLLGKAVQNEIKKYPDRYLLLDHTTPVPIKNRYKTPETLGRDRLAAVVGANAQFPKRGSLVIDAGTCIKYDYISPKAVYKGGSISPGMQMRLDAMHHFTAKLPLVEPFDYKGIMGIDTESAILTGAQLGALSEIRGMIASYVEKYGRIKVIITGGDAIFFAKRLKRKIFVSPNLVLIGLNNILNFNSI